MDDHKIVSHIDTVIKINGTKQAFDANKIENSIWYAARKVGGKDRNRARMLSFKVLQIISEKYQNGKPLRTTEIGEFVEKVLIESGHSKTAKEFIRFRENKKHFRQDKGNLGVEDDIGLTYNTLYILKRRYLKRNEKGEIIETPKGMLKRVAEFLADVEKTKTEKKKWYEKFMSIMETFEFLPGTRPLVNAGKKKPQLGNCFVWPIKDDINHIFKILHESTLIKKNGGGCGYNFSKLRPEDDIVGGIPDLAAGPVKIIEMFDLMTSLFRQEGRYESGNMVVLNANHPDIFKFVSAKQTDGYLSKTNLSVGITDSFMKAATEDKDWDLINPRTGEVVNTVKARSILELMATMAWQTGDPGILNLSAINRGDEFGNPLLKKHGRIVSTNVCGEIPQYPYESCNLGYVNFTKFIRDGKFDFKHLKEVMSIAVRLMDNVIEASWFPVPEVTKAVKDHRRIGIGCVGWAETLSRLGLAYDSKDAYELAEKVTETMYKSAFNASVELADDKGPFPLVGDSIWANRKRKPRNVALLTFPPSSGNAVICETSFGIEPYFALAYEQNVLGGMRLRTVVPAFVEKLKEEGLYSEELIQKIIDNHGSVQSIKEVPERIKKIFKVAHDIDWKDHIKMQASFQKWTDNAITKTINMPASATPDDIEQAYVMAWELGCKGLTVYRDKTKQDQVFEFGKSEEPKKSTRKCPNCEHKLVKQGKCYKCKECGYSSCEI
ncbi:adenosylcobalamin-dependent ribonucleoside-diphosphate reductase [Candidatus Woesebacteria bacterium]|nr:adenosylcobalamin-dependent ribonucleoside-diphosphate reductase [Candidatus Woesebacteria bacterium]